MLRRYSSELCDQHICRLTRAACGSQLFLEFTGFGVLRDVEMQCRSNSVHQGRGVVPAFGELSGGANEALVTGDFAQRRATDALNCVRQ